MSVKDFLATPLGIFSIVFLAAGSIALIFGYYVHFIEMNLANTLAAVFLMGFVTFLAWAIRETTYVAKLKLVDVEYHVFKDHYGESLRILIKVKNEGKVIAKWVKPLLSIQSDIGKYAIAKEESTKMNSEHKYYAPCEKEGFTCPICIRDVRGFLCPYPFTVSDNYLCWTVPEVEAGKGLYGRYCHVTNIPPGDAQYIVLADVYRDEQKGFTVVKFMSEYGTESKPRICLKFPLNEEISVNMKIKIVGENSKTVEYKAMLEMFINSLKVCLEGREYVCEKYGELKKLPMRYSPEAYVLK